MSTDSTKRTLKAIQAFKELSPDEIQDLDQHCRWRRFLPGQSVIIHQDKSTDVYFIASGKVRITIYSPAGKQITFRDMSPGEMFGELSAIDDKPRTAHAIALSESLIGSMDSDVFWGVLRQHPSVVAATLRKLSDIIRMMCERVFEFTVLNVPTRVYAELIRMARPDSEDDNRAVIAPPPTHAEIASRISTHREAVTRELNDLEHSGLIERHDDKLVLRDLSKLAEIIERRTGS